MFEPVSFPTRTSSLDSSVVSCSLYSEACSEAIPWLVRSPTGGHLDSSQDGAVIENASMDICVHVFVWT